jgi:hypothetical protein
MSDACWYRSVRSFLERFQNHAFDWLGQIRPRRAGRRWRLVQDRGRDHRARRAGKRWTPVAIS